MWPQKSNPIDDYENDPVFCTEVDWRIKLDGTGDAYHSLYIKLINLGGRERSNALTLDLYNRGTYSKFGLEFCNDSREQKIDANDLGLEPGFISEYNRYSLTLGSIKTAINKLAREGKHTDPFTTIHLTFLHKNMITEFDGRYFFLMPTKIRLLANSVDMVIVLPSMNWWQKTITQIRRLRKRDPLFIVKDLPIYTTIIQPRVDGDQGIVEYNLRDDNDFQPLAFGYMGYYPISPLSLFLGFLSGLISAGLIIIAAINDLFGLRDIITNYFR